MLAALNALTHRFHRLELLDSDPLRYVHRFKNPSDQEVVACIAALLAYGRVRQIFVSVEKVLGFIERSGLTPAQYVDSGFFRKDLDLKSWRHRVTSGEDLISFFEILWLDRDRFGTLGAAWASHHDPEALTIEAAQNAWVASAWASVEKYKIPYRKRGLSFLLNAPDGGSCCKRWMMLLRWMVRKDHLDLGLWQGQVLPSQLIIPMDTHVARISEYLGLRKRKAVDWRAALEVTAALRRLDPVDPVRFDFGIARLGILDLCQRKYLKEICEKCDLVKVCRYANRS